MTIRINHLSTAINVARCATIFRVWRLLSKHNCIGIIGQAGVGFCNLKPAQDICELPVIRSVYLRELRRIAREVTCMVFRVSNANDHNILNVPTASREVCPLLSDF